MQSAKVEMACPSTPIFEGFAINDGDSAYGSVRSYYCTDGCSSFSSTQSTITCESNGLWTMPSGCLCMQPSGVTDLSSSTSGFYHFGRSLAVVPDIDGDNFPELLVGEEDMSTYGFDRVSLIGCFRKPTSCTSSVLAIDQFSGFTATIDIDDNFGHAIASIYPLSEPQVYVSALDDDDGSINSGAVYVIILQSGGTPVKSFQKISSTHGDFTANLPSSHGFGHSITTIGDLDRDNFYDIAVSADLTSVGLVYLLFLNSMLMVKSFRTIQPGQTGGFTVPYQSGLNFGKSLAGRPNDLGVDILVGATGYVAPDSFTHLQGAVYLIRVRLSSSGEPESTEAYNYLFAQSQGAFTGNFLFQTIFLELWR